MKMLRLGLCFVGLLVGVFELYAADPVTLKLRYPEGRTVRYKNRFSFRYFSDKGEIILKEGTFEVRTYGEWRSRETVVLAEAEGAKGDSVKVIAGMDKAGSRVMLSGQQLTYKTFPYTLDMLDKLLFSWGVGPGGRPDRFGPEFPTFKMEREDMITDLRQVWMPGLTPVLPEKAVGVGETWTGEQRIEAPFYNFAVGNEPSLIAFTSTYKLKKIKKKKEKRCLNLFY